MILTHLVLLGFLAGAGGSETPSTPEPTVTNQYAGGWHPHLWIAHINGKRYVGTYDEIESIAVGVVEKTEKKPRIVIKPLRKAPEGASVDQEVMAAPAQAKQVQEQLYINLMPFLAKVLEKRQQDENDDLDAILLLI